MDFTNGIPTYQIAPATTERVVRIHPHARRLTFDGPWLPPDLRDRFIDQCQAAFDALYAEYQARQQEPPHAG